MSTPTTITLSFPDGLMPQRYSDLHAAAEGYRTAGEQAARTELNTCRGVLFHIAVQLGMPAGEALDIASSDEHEGNNYPALGNSILQAIKKRGKAPAQPGQRAINVSDYDLLVSVVNDACVDANQRVTDARMNDDEHSGNLEALAAALNNLRREIDQS